MKYSGSDFKFTSQANHLQKLLALKAENHRENIHAQRLYKRRRFRNDGSVMSNWMILNQSALDTQSRPQNVPAQSSSENDNGDNWTPIQEIVTPVNTNSDNDDDYYWEQIGGGN
jgi:hypothetical protein